MLFGTFGLSGLPSHYYGEFDLLYPQIGATFDNPRK
jgi:hypothetical protein